MYKICGDAGFALLRDFRPLHCYSLISLFQALCQCGRLKKRAGNEQGLVEKEGPSPFHSRILLAADPACHLLTFRLSSLTESLEQAIC